MRYQLCLIPFKLDICIKSALRCYGELFLNTVYDQNKAHAQMTKFWGCALFKYLPELVLELVLFLCLQHNYLI